MTRYLRLALALPLLLTPSLGCKKPLKGKASGEAEYSLRDNFMEESGEGKLSWTATLNEEKKLVEFELTFRRGKSAHSTDDEWTCEGELPSPVPKKIEELELDCTLKRKKGDDSAMCKKPTYEAAMTFDDEHKQVKYLEIKLDAEPPARGGYCLPTYSNVIVRTTDAVDIK